MKVSQQKVKKQYLAMFDRVDKDTKLIDRIKKEACSFSSVMTRKAYKLRNQGDFNKLSVNVLSVVASFFNLRGKDFAKMRLINKKMKKAYERHVLSYIYIENLATEMGPVRELEAKKTVKFLLDAANDALPGFFNSYEKQELKLGDKNEAMKQARSERITALTRDGTELLWRVKDHKEIEIEVIRVFKEVFCRPHGEEPDDEEDWNESEPLLEHPTKLFKLSLQVSLFLN